jgi:hypothetical protein
MWFWTGAALLLASAWAAAVLGRTSLWPQRWRCACCGRRATQPAADGPPAGLLAALQEFAPRDAAAAAPAPTQVTPNSRGR